MEWKRGQGFPLSLIYTVATGRGRVTVSQGVAGRLGSGLRDAGGESVEAGVFFLPNISFQYVVGNCQVRSKGYNYKSNAPVAAQYQKAGNEEAEVMLGEAKVSVTSLSALSKFCASLFGPSSY